MKLTKMLICNCGGEIKKLHNDYYDMDYIYRCIKCNKESHDLFGIEITPINICSTSDDELGRALTNPVWGSKKDGKNYYDVESNYRKRKSTLLLPDGRMLQDMVTMVKLIVVKFKQNPELIDEIDKRGGEVFLQNCSHLIGIKRSRWEGVGEKSNFINVLVTAYKIIKGTL